MIEIPFEDVVLAAVGTAESSTVDMRILLVPAGLVPAGLDRKVTNC